jgi:hypothetical protein
MSSDEVARKGASMAKYARPATLGARKSTYYAGPPRSNDGIAIAL